MASRTTTGQPNSQPTSLPTGPPTGQPTRQPPSLPSCPPTGQSTSQPPSLLSGSITGFCVHSLLRIQSFLFTTGSVHDLHSIQLLTTTTTTTTASTTAAATHQSPGINPQYPVRVPPVLQSISRRQNPAITFAGHTLRVAPGSRSPVVINHQVAKRYSLRVPPVPQVAISRLSPVIRLQSSINLKTTTSHSKQLYNTGKEQDASGQEGWTPLHLLLDRLAVVAFLYFLHDRTSYACNFFGMRRISWRRRHRETILCSISRHVYSVIVLCCFTSTDLEYDKRIAYS